jgi:hypothetical protein
MHRIRHSRVRVTSAYVIGISETSDNRYQHPHHLCVAKRAPAPSDFKRRCGHYSTLAVKMSLSSLLAPITLPLASFLAIPMFSSWSTSLNLVFMSLAWTTVAATYSPLQLEFFAPFLLRLALYIVPSTIFLLFDIALPSLALEFKAQGEWGIATRQRGGKAKVRRVVLWSCINVLLIVGVQALVEFLVTDVLRMRSLLVIKGSRWGLNHLPNPWTMIKHALVGGLARNVSNTLAYTALY